MYKKAQWGSFTYHHIPNIPNENCHNDVRALVFTINSNSATACIHLHIHRLALILFLPASKYLDSIPSRTYVRIYEVQHITILYNSMFKEKKNQFKSQSCPEMGMYLFSFFLKKMWKRLYMKQLEYPLLMWKGCSKQKSG
jgi:hypothetical protein